MCVLRRQLFLACYQKSTLRRFSVKHWMTIFVRVPSTDATFDLLALSQEKAINLRIGLHLPPGQKWCTQQDQLVVVFFFF